jgi:hypothetical protein
MSAIDLLAKNLVTGLETLKMHLADFSDADMLVRPVPNANHAAWQVGHVLAFEVMCCKMYAPAAAPQGLPPDMEKTYGKEGSTSDDPKRFLKKDELLKHLAQVNAGLAGWVRSLSPEDLTKPGPEQFKGWVNTIGELILAIPVHETMHLGQIQVIRRKLGKKVLF